MTVRQRLDQREHNRVQREARWEAVLWFRAKGETLQQLGLRFGLSPTRVRELIGEANRWKLGRYRHVLERRAQLSLLPILQALLDESGDSK